MKLYVRFTRFFKIKYGTPYIHSSARVLKPLYISKDFSLGCYSFINKGCYIGSKVVCGNFVMFGPYVTIAGGDHAFDLVGQPMYFQEDKIYRPLLLVMMYGLELTHV